MHRKLLISIALIVAVPGIVTADEIVWRSDRPLTWNDFEGRVSDEGDERRVAATAASLGWSYGYEVEWSDAGCAYRITEIRSSAVFETGESWVKSDHREPDVLAHEQGHFDIAELYRRAFDAEAGPLLGTGGSCAGQTRRRVTRFVAEAIQARLGPVYDRVWADYNAAQAQYDAETEHGMAAAAQQRWTRQIADGLSDLTGWPLATTARR